MTYSGGKDSDVLLHLALECLQPDEFEVQNSHTTLDAPQTVYHIREVFTELDAQNVKTLIYNRPSEEQEQITIWDLILKNKFPPTRLARYCCKQLKEKTTPNRLIATGVRAYESRGRRNREAFGVRVKAKVNAHYYSLDHVKEVFEEALADSKENNLPVEEISPYDCTFIENAKKNTDEIVNPIYDWTDQDVWDYIADRQIKVCELYDQGYKRVGCIGCPLSGRKGRCKSLADFPTYKDAFIKLFDKVVVLRKQQGLKCNWSNGTELFLWWTEDKDFMQKYKASTVQTGEVNA